MRCLVTVVGVSGLALSMGCKSKCQVGYGEGPDGNCYPIQMDTAAETDTARPSPSAWLSMAVRLRTPPPWSLSAIPGLETVWAG